MIMDEISIFDPIIDKPPIQLIENIKKYDKTNHTGQEPQFSQEKRFKKN